MKLSRSTHIDYHDFWHDLPNINKIFGRVINKILYILIYFHIDFK